MTLHIDPQTSADVQTAFITDDLKIFRTVKELPYAIVGCNPETKLITDRWIGGFDNENEFREVLEFICKQFETGEYKYWLADLRLLNTGFFHSDRWLAEYLFPKVIDAGLVREAVVLPEFKNEPVTYDVFGSASSALKKITDGRIRGFTDISEAKSWLFGLHYC